MFGSTRRLAGRRLRRLFTLVSAASIAASVQFLVPGVLSPRIAHADPSVPTSFPIFTDPGSPADNQGPGTTIVSGPGGDLWISDEVQSIVRLAPSGTATTCATSGTQGGVATYSQGIAVGSDGNLWVTLKQTYVDSHFTLVEGVIARVTPSCAVTYFRTPTSSSFPYSIAAGPSGYTWFTENAANNIAAINTAGSMREFAIPTPSSLPTGIVAGPDGNLWFTESASDKIGRMTPGGTFTEFALASGAQPYDIAVGSDGKLWFTELGRSAIGTITTAGTGYVEYPTTTPGSSPARIASGPDGALWFTENNVAQIGRITTSGATVEYGVPGNDPYGISAGPDGNIWYTDWGVFHSPAESNVGVGRLPLLPCGDLTNSVTSSSDGTGLRDTPGSQQTVQINLSNCGVPSLTNATTTTAVTPPSGCPAAPSIAAFTATLAYAQSTAQTTSFADPSCVGTYTVTTTTTMGSSTVATTTTYYVVSNGKGSHIVGDFNGDGYEDLAIADIGTGPSISDGTCCEGVVHVYYGGLNGLDMRDSQTFTENTPGMPSQPPVLSFGQSLAAGDYNGDGYSDLAIGAGGTVVVLWGGPAGLTTNGSQLLSAPSNANGFFGRTMVSGDFNHNGFADLAIAAPLTNGVVAEEGAVDIMYGSPSGLTGGTVVTESSPGMPGPAPTHYDTLGWNMAVGDFKHNGYSDLAMVEGGNKCAVAVLYGSPSGITFTGAQYLQAVGCSDYADFVAAGDFTGNGYDDLAIGEPFGGSLGLVEIHYGSSAGLGSVAFGTAQKITPSTKGMPAAAKGGGDFGAGLATGDVKHNGHADLVIPGNSGCVILWGTSAKLTAVGSKLLPMGCGGISIIDALGFGTFSGSGYADFVHCASPAPDVLNPSPNCSVYPGSSTGLAASPAYVSPEIAATGLSVASNHDSY